MYRWWKERIQNECISDEREEKKNIELPMGYIKWSVENIEHGM